MSDLEIFKLGISLALALKGDNEAIADVKLIYERHPEMFKNLEDLIATTKEVANDPEIIMKNPKARNELDFMVGKKLDPNKMADIGIRNDNGTNVIFHVNKTRIANFKYFKKKGLLVETPTLSTRQDLLAGGECRPKAISTTLNPIIPQTLLNNLITSKSINEFAKNLVEIIKVSPDNKLSFYDDICKQTKFKTNLIDINKEKIHKAINNLSINKPGLLEALIKTNLKSFKENLELDSYLGIRR